MILLNNYRCLIDCYTHFNIDIYRDSFDIIASELDQNSLFRLGIKLNLPYRDVDEIFNRDINYYQKIYQILTSWRQQNGRYADLKHIVVILLSMNKKAIADKVNAKLHY